ncbi:MAG: hypothetical protein AB8A46_08925 [Prochlorococcus sp.]
MLLKATAKREGLFAKQGVAMHNDAKQDHAKHNHAKHNHAKHNVKDKSSVEQIWSDGLPLR